jgi:ammonia channel protein AmtB
MAFEGQTGEVTILGKMYRGFSITPLGSFIGLSWALADGFVGGLIFAWLYNIINGKWGNSK